MQERQLAGATSALGPEGMAIGAAVGMDASKREGEVRELQEKDDERIQKLRAKEEAARLDRIASQLDEGQPSQNTYSPPHSSDQRPILREQYIDSRDKGEREQLSRQMSAEQQRMRQLERDNIKLAQALQQQGRDSQNPGKIRRAARWAFSDWGGKKDRGQQRIYNVIRKPYEIGAALVYLIIFLALISVIGLFLLTGALYGGAYSLGKFRQAYDDYGFTGIINIIWDLIVQTFNAILAIFHLSVKGIQQTYEEAYSGIYVGEVDQNAKERLGVFIEEIEAADPEFRADEPITIWARLRAKTLDKPIHINLSCDADGVPYDLLNPRNQFTVDQEEEMDLDCTFYKNKLQSGLVKIKFQAVFDFQTLSYLKTYFMDMQTLRSMKRENIDFKDRFDISPGDPRAIYTSGPVGMGIGMLEPPMGIDTTQPGKELPLSIRFQNDWEGEILDISSMTVMLPKGMYLQDDLGNIDKLQEATYCGGFTFSTCGNQEADECQYANENNIYLLDQTGNHTKLIQNELFGIKDYKSLRCRVYVPEESYELMLGNTPLATRYIKVTTGYKYKLEESKSVALKKGEEVNGKIQQSTCKSTIERGSDTFPADWFTRIKEARYAKYQSDVRKFARSKIPEGIDRIQIEAMVAVVMDISTGVGDVDNRQRRIDEDNDGLPDYIAGCWVHRDFSSTHRDNTEIDISCATQELKRYLIEKPGDIKYALEKYFEDRGKSLDTYVKSEGTDPRKEVMKYYYSWLNKLCNGGKLPSAAQSTTTTQTSTDGTLPATSSGLTQGAGTFMGGEPQKQVQTTEITFTFTAVTRSEESVYVRKSGAETFNKPVFEKSDDDNIVRITKLESNTAYEYYVQSLDTVSGKIQRYPSEGTASFTTNIQQAEVT